MGLNEGFFTSVVFVLFWATVESCPTLFTSVYHPHTLIISCKAQCTLENTWKGTNILKHVFHDWFLLNLFVKISKVLIKSLLRLVSSVWLNFLASTNDPEFRLQGCFGRSFPLRNHLFSSGDKKSCNNPLPSSSSGSSGGRHWWLNRNDTTILNITLIPDLRAGQRCGKMT